MPSEERPAPAGSLAAAATRRPRGDEPAPQVLVVDDEPGIRALARAFLRAVGVEVLEAADGEEALAVLARERVDLVLLDVTMPRKDGFAALAELRRLPGWRAVPVVMVTALDDAEAINRAYELGATDFVTKPIQWSILRYRVLYMLRASRAFAQLERSRSRLADAQRIARLGHWDWERASRRVSLSGQTRRILGLAEAVPVPADLLGLLPARDRAALRRQVRRCLVGRGFAETDLHVPPPGGETRFVRVRAEPVRDDAGLLVGLAGTVQDVTEERRAAEERRVLASAVEQSPTSVVITDPQGCIEYVNPVFERVTGYSLAEAIGQTPRILKSGYMADDVYRGLWSTIAAGREWQGELCNRRKNGELFWESARISPLVGEDGSILHFVAIKEDITIRKQYEERLIHQANFDDLTGLPNRLLAFDRLARAVVQGRASGRTVGVIYIDLDHFKEINEILGHAAGDELLGAVAQRLNGAVEEADTVARLGGDEFLLILPEATGPAQIEARARRVLDALASPFDLAGREVFVNASAGITLAPADGEDPHLLLRNAETAMYRAKRRSGASHEFFTPSVSEEAAERLLVEAHLRRALHHRELHLHFQPICDARTGRIVAAEALLRWTSPELGAVRPDRFIPVAEDSGLIVPIGAWVLETACREAVRWAGVIADPPRVAVNISPRQINGEDFVTVVRSALAATGLAAERLELELTERLLVDDDPATAATLNQIEALGVRLSLDDFGTGQSSLAYLRRFRFDVLKIDRGFVSGGPRDAGGSALVAAIVAMGRALGLQVLAEGVETGAQLEVLRALGCDLVQGFLLGRPVPSEDLGALVAAGMPAAAVPPGPARAGRRRARAGAGLPPPVDPET